MRVVSDIEADSLTPKRIWCVVNKDVDTDEVHVFLEHQKEEFKEFSEKVTEFIGHNFLSFDAPALNDLWGTSIPINKITDTLILSKMDKPDRELPPEMATIPPEKRTGPHSLQSWGMRMGDYKIDFSDFSHYTQEMLDYCIQDVELTHVVYKFLMKRLAKCSEQSIRMEHTVRWIMDKQKRDGIYFDKPQAELLAAELREKIREAEKEVHKTMKPLPKFIKEITPERVKDGSKWKTGSLKYLGDNFQELVVGPFSKIDFPEFNLGSRPQVAEQLIRKGWKPSKFTPTGQPQIDEEVLENVEFEEAKVIYQYMMLTKRLGDVDKWINACDENNLIHANVDSLGANTNRMTHCVPLSTKALTKRGWVSHFDLKIGEDILGFNLTTGKKEWTKVLSKSLFNNARIGSVGTQQRRIKCTEDHKHVVVKSSGKPYQKYIFKKSNEITTHDAILINAPYSNPITASSYDIPNEKYNYNHLQDILNLTDDQQKAFMIGFLLADGYLKSSTNGNTKSWSFTQAEGDILDTVQTIMYLQSDTRVSRTCKTLLKNNNQRYGYNITNTQCSWMRSSKSMKWVYESIGDVWCPTTELGTWVMMQDDGIITITGNSDPNMAQVTSVDKPYGKEQRSLFKPRAPKRVIVGTDASGLEARCLAHRVNDDEFTKGILDSDIHTFNQNFFGLPTRNAAKPAYYCLVYGGGDAKFGSVVGGGAKEGAALKAKYYQRFPNLKVIQDAYSGLKQGSRIVGIDGRLLNLRHVHAALNLDLQSMGAIITKYWMIEIQKEIYRQKLDAIQILQVHDEYQFDVHTKDLHTFLKVPKIAIKRVEKLLNMKCPLDCETKYGDSWAETH